MRAPSEPVGGVGFSKKFVSLPPSSAGETEADKSGEYQSLLAMALAKTHFFVWKSQSHARLIAVGITVCSLGGKLVTMAEHRRTFPERRDEGKIVLFTFSFYLSFGQRRSASYSPAVFASFKAFLRSSSRRAFRALSATALRTAPFSAPPTAQRTPHICPTAIALAGYCSLN